MVPGGTLVNEVRLRHSAGSWRDFEVVATNMTARSSTAWAWTRRTLPSLTVLSRWRGHFS
jgi:hypothetical protein